MLSNDPVRRLQDAARAAIAYIAPGRVVGSVVVLDGEKEVIIEMFVPACGPRVEEVEVKPAVSPVGWHLTDRNAMYDGRTIAISRPKLLRVLVETGEGITIPQLTTLAFGQQGSDANTRYHLVQLKKELKAAFPEFEGDILQCDENVYRLMVR
jgi:hypothetical protein